MSRTRSLVGSASGESMPMPLPTDPNPQVPTPSRTDNALTALRLLVTPLPSPGIQWDPSIAALYTQHYSRLLHLAEAFGAKDDSPDVVQRVFYVYWKLTHYHAEPRRDPYL